MKKLQKPFCILSLFCACIFLFSCVTALPVNEWSNARPVTDAEVLAVFNLTNEFRTSGTADYWNKDNSAKVKVGKLSALTLDKDLCKAAALRANEIVQNFSHTRPDGSSCFTVLRDFSISYSGVGENIAAGNKSGEKTFLQWKEEDKDYSGQGHRRNLLGDFTKIGIACTYDENSTYKYYWVMILAK